MQWAGKMDTKILCKSSGKIGLNLFTLAQVAPMMQLCSVGTASQKYRIEDDKGSDQDPNQGQPQVEN